MLLSFITLLGEALNKNLRWNVLPQQLTVPIYILLYCLHIYKYIYIYIYLLQSCCNNYVPYFSKLLKTHFFVMQIFRSHFGSFFCASSASSIYIHIFVCVYICIYIYILKRHYREIEKSILHKRMMAKKKLYIQIYMKI